MKRDDLESLLTNLQHMALLILQKINSLDLKIPIISLQNINYMDAKLLFSTTKSYISVANLVKGNLKNEIEVLMVSPELFSRKLEEYEADLDKIATMADYLAVVKTILSNKDEKNTSLLKDVAEFCHEVMLFLSSLYGYELSEYTYFMVPLLRISGVHSITSLEMKDSNNVLYVGLFPYNLYGTPDFYVLTLHEFGHLFKTYYLLRKKKWSHILNRFMERLRNSKRITKIEDNIRYKSWVNELFADYFAFMTLGKSYVDAFWRRFGYYVSDKEFAEFNELSYPPLTLRFKILDIAFDELEIKKKPSYLSYIDKILKENSNEILAGYFEYHELIEVLSMLSTLFYKTITENPYNKPPYFVIAENSDDFFRLYSVIMILN